MEQRRQYLVIDLKSFYASVECVERGLDPLSTNLVVADPNRTEKTICLAVSPSMKAYGIPGRPRLFEVVQIIDEVNRKRKLNVPGCRFSGKSVLDSELKDNPDLEVDYIVAQPRMAKYVACSDRIYNIYLRYVAPEDIHVYSVDEVFIDVTPYLSTYKMSARELAIKMIREVLDETGVTATAGIGTNMYLCKVAMDIMAKKIPAGPDGVRIAELDEEKYRRELWGHRPITDFWRVGRGTARTLDMYGIRTMGQLARASLKYEPFLYKLFGVNAELLIDHAWGYESCTMKEIKEYRPVNRSLCSGQVLSEPYTYEKARVVVQEMADNIALKMFDHGVVTDQLHLSVRYDTECLTNPAIRSKYKGDIRRDHYGRLVPKRTHGIANLEVPTSSCNSIVSAIAELYDKVANPNLLIRRLSITANHIMLEDEVKHEDYRQLALFEDYEVLRREKQQKAEERAKERSMQETLLNIKKKFGKNAILKGLNYAEGATARERNQQIGGHKA
jgi:DNA polymerase V